MDKETTAVLRGWLEFSKNFQDLNIEILTSLALLERDTQKLLEEDRYKVVLTYVDPHRQVPVVSIIKNELGLTLTQAKTFINHLPQVIQLDLTYLEADKLRKTLWNVDAYCYIDDI